MIDRNSEGVGRGGKLEMLFAVLIVPVVDSKPPSHISPLSRMGGGGGPKPSSRCCRAVLLKFKAPRSPTRAAQAVCICQFEGTPMHISVL